MRDALNKTGRAIFYSMCEWGVENPAEWAANVGNSWRTTGDIEDTWDSVLKILDQQVNITQYAAPGGWNDPDMLEVGNGHMTYDEYVAHFSLWALLKAPLLIGCDVRSISKETLNILTNQEVIDVNQDPMGISGYRVYKQGNVEVWAGPLLGNSVAAVLFNRGETSAQIPFNFKDVGYKAKTRAVVRDLWKHQTVAVATDVYTAQVPRHAVVMVKVTPLK